MVNLQLLLVFARLALFAFGGGNALIGIMEKELQLLAWITPSEYANIAAISMVTPGATGINLATYVGYIRGGILGSIVATFALISPGFLIVIAAVHFYEKFKKSKTIQAVIQGMVCVAIGLIISAAWAFLKLTPISSIRSIIVSVVLFGGSAYVNGKTKINPIAFILACAVFGMILY